MSRIKMIVSYDGTNYHGWQVQTKLQAGFTIQETIERALSKLLREEIKIVASGRTDAGVHALAQVTHFDTKTTMPIERLPLALKPFLPDDIVVLEACNAKDDFHARFNAKWKTYRYIIDNNKNPNVFLRNFTYHFPRPLNLEKMQLALSYLIGTHDFSSFCASNTSVKNFVRTIKEAKVKKENNLIYIELTGNGFLYNMVRIIVGTLLDIGLEKKAPEFLREALLAKDRRQAGKTAPAQGLCLFQVSYEDELFDDER